MATRRQGGTAQRQERAAVARRKRSIAHLPKAVSTDHGRQAADSRRRGGEPGRSLEGRTRQQIYELAKRRVIEGRSRMGKWELIEAIRKAS